VSSERAGSDGNNGQYQRCSMKAHRDREGAIHVTQGKVTKDAMDQKRRAIAYRFNQL
jgi:hypothetical protein